MPCKIIFFPCMWITLWIWPSPWWDPTLILKVTLCLGGLLSMPHALVLAGVFLPCPSPPCSRKNWANHANATVGVSFEFIRRYSIARVALADPMDAIVDTSFGFLGRYLACRGSHSWPYGHYSGHLFWIFWKLSSMQGSRSQPCGAFGFLRSYPACKATIADSYGCYSGRHFLISWKVSSL